MLHDKGLDFFYMDTTIRAAQAWPSASIDLKAVSRKLFAGKRPLLRAVVNVAFTSGGAATLQLTLQDSADDSSFAAVMNSVTQEAVQTEAIPVAELTLGYEFALAMPPNQALRRYIRLNAVVATAAMTAGTLTAGFVAEYQTNHY